MSQTVPPSRKTDGQNRRRNSVSPGQPPKPRNEKREITNADKIRLAQLSLTINPSKGRFWKLSEIAESEGRSISVVSRAISSAFRERLVRVEVIKITDPKRNVMLEHRIRERFPRAVHLNLRNIRVIDCSDELHGTNDLDPRYGDIVHRCLGQALAKEFAVDGIWDQPNKTVGLGSGRSVFYTIEALNKYPKLNWGNSTLVSLSGQVDARDHSGEIGSNLDADFHVNLLALRLSNAGNARTQTIQVGKSITDFEGQFTSTSIWNQWQTHRPKFAIVGVGTLVRGHRFFNAIDEKPKPVAIRSEILDKLADLIKICKSKTFTEIGFCPVGDICNYLFYVPAPPGVISTAAETSIRTKINGINERLLTFSIPEFAKIENTIVLAGTAAKAAAVLELITGRDTTRAPISIDRLYIDAGAANAILEMADAYPKT